MHKVKVWGIGNNRINSVVWEREMSTIAVQDKSCVLLITKCGIGIHNVYINRFTTNFFSCGLVTILFAYPDFKRGL